MIFVVFLNKPIKKMRFLPKFSGQKAKNVHPLAPGGLPPE